jgi:hypothetical protein
VEIVTDNISMIGPTTDDVAVKTEVARHAAAERMRRCRARRRAGYRCVLIEISNNEIGGLVRSGLLSADDSEDLDAIQTAVYDFFEQTIGRPS